MWIQYPGWKRHQCWSAWFGKSCGGRDGFRSSDLMGDSWIQNGPGTDLSFQNDQFTLKTVDWRHAPPCNNYEIIARKEEILWLPRKSITFLCQILSSPSTQLARWPPAKNGSNRNVRAMELFNEILMTNSDLVVSSSLLSLKACTRAVAVAWMSHTEIPIWKTRIIELGLPTDMFPGASGVGNLTRIIELGLGEGAKKSKKN